MNCFSCGEHVLLKRWQLGYRVCLDCGEIMARAVKHTQLPLNKRERFQEAVGEFMCAVVLMLFFGILIYAPVLFVGLVN